jgi:glyoxylase-like metal-dependent hydrolase (beta-lactamase superfamily II)
MEDILKLVRLNYEGRLVLVDGDYQMENGVDAFFVGGHTPGTQGVRVSGKDRTIWISGDITPFYRNFKEEIPPGIYSNLQEILLAYGNIRRRLGPRDDILPGHDPEVANQFPFNNGIARIL